MGRRRQVRLHTLKMAYSWPGMASPRGEQESAIFSKLLEYMAQSVCIFISFQRANYLGVRGVQEKEPGARIRESGGWQVARVKHTIPPGASRLSERVACKRSSAPTHVPATMPNATPLRDGARPRLLVPNALRLLPSRAYTILYLGTPRNP
jgi:hypothetical protein